MKASQRHVAAEDAGESCGEEEHEGERQTETAAAVVTDRELMLSVVDECHYRITLARTAPFYRGAAGFEVEPLARAPAPMKAEAGVGAVIARAVADDELVCMVRRV